jgi:hypothetical protein
MGLSRVKRAGATYVREDEELPGILGKLLFRGMSRRSYMKMSMWVIVVTPLLIILAIYGFALSVGWASQKQFVRLKQATQAAEQEAVADLPVGSTKAEVSAWLVARGFTTNDVPLQSDARNLQTEDGRSLKDAKSQIAGTKAIGGDSRIVLKFYFGANEKLLMIEANPSWTFL